MTSVKRLNPLYYIEPGCFKWRKGYQPAFWKSFSLFGSVDYGHADEALSKTISLIADCEAVFCARIGSGVEKELRINGIKPVEAPYYS